MLKNILKLQGAQELTKNEQKSISGGTKICCEWCFDGTCLDWAESRSRCPISAGCNN
jgi:hypothetical protein